MVLDRTYTSACNTDGWTYLGDRIYVLGPDPDERLAFENVNGTVYYPHTDRQGSTIAMSTAGSNVLTLTYDAYGQPSQAVNDVGPGASSYPYLYTGQLYDAFLQAYDHKSRVYSAVDGRFWQPDPIGTADDVDLYSYTQNSPLTGTDPTGQACVIANGWSDFCRRADLYQNYDALLGGRTRFFGAAAMTVTMIADLDMPIVGQLALSGGSRSFLSGLSHDLEQMNGQEALAIEHGTLGGIGLDDRLVHAEQSSVQAHLNALSSSDPGAYASLISQVNGLLNPNGSAAAAASMYSSDRQYHSILNSSRSGLGRDIDFSRQGDREAIGNALEHYLKSSGACDATGTHIKSC